MSRFVERTTARVDLGGGDWVEIRTRLTFGDRRALVERLLGARIALAVGDDETLHHREADVELLRRSIAAWGGPGFCEFPAHPHEGECRPREITAESLEQLDETGERIMLEIKKRQVTHSADLKGTPSGSSSAARRGGRASANSRTGSTTSSSANASAGRGTN